MAAKVKPLLDKTMILSYLIKMANSQNIGRWKIAILSPVSAYCYMLGHQRLTHIVIYCYTLSRLFSRLDVIKCK